MAEKPKFLVVDDSEVSRTTLSSFFSEIGCDVVCEESGEGAWQALNAGFKFDLVILDWHMPMGMSGAALNKKILSDPRFKNLAVVAFTSKADPNMENAESREWLSSFLDSPRGKALVNSVPIVAKEGGESDARRLTPDLIFNVVDGLKKSGKTAPMILNEMYEWLKETGEHGKKNRG